MEGQRHGRGVKHTELFILDTWEKSVSVDISIEVRRIRWSGGGVRQDGVRVMGS